MELILFNIVSTHYLCFLTDAMSSRAAGESNAAVAAGAISSSEEYEAGNSEGSYIHDLNKLLIVSTSLS